ncbi:MAG: hypothetical protein HETSPECPRED_005748 [Heterodermia speciosa]|uniref:Uncharacterized protein n=1 Tax=Heterodermia speciosa TaxID=116794 RepID=A0A8H3FIB6_9LECA|nr:MAG: hypothetical protein HETSPECPRED_005748 [Heterodermia speciosa]
MLVQFALLALHAATARAIRASNNSTIAEAFPQLLIDFPNLVESPPSLTSRYTNGRQDFQRCCSLAVYESLHQNDNDSISLASPSFIGSDLDSFRHQQYPCGASYDGSSLGAPPVTVTYGWCSSHCPGWQISKSTKLNQWVLPVFGFIVPAIVFCLSIPRRRKLEIWEELFNVPLHSLAVATRAPFVAIVTFILITIDTIAWLMVIFAMAGPILTSGIYEALMDNRILAYLQEMMRDGRLSTAQRCQLMYVVLVGNLDTLAHPNASDEHNTPWNHISGPAGLLRGLEVGKPRKIKKHLVKTKTWLRTMLADQDGFGITVGAPVVFYCGGFVYTSVDNYSKLGDNSTSHALGIFTPFVLCNVRGLLNHLL